MVVVCQYSPAANIETGVLATGGSAPSGSSATAAAVAPYFPALPRGYVQWREYVSYVCLTPGVEYNLHLFNTFAASGWGASSISIAVPEATVVAPVGLGPTRKEGCLNFSVPEAASADKCLGNSWGCQVAFGLLAERAALKLPLYQKLHRQKRAVPKAKSGGAMALASSQKRRLDFSVQKLASEEEVGGV
eukprot:gene2452-8565_t